MISHENGLFRLETDSTGYYFCILPCGQAEHLYYGRRIVLPTPEPLAEKKVFPHGYSIAYTAQTPEISLLDLRLEYSGVGKGDYREPFVELVRPDGSTTTDFVYDGFEISQGKRNDSGLPGSYGEAAEHLALRLVDRDGGERLTLHYWVYPDCDVITRAAVLENATQKPLAVTRLMSTQLDFSDDDLRFTGFHGAWGREMQRADRNLSVGTAASGSTNGTSSNMANPFVMLSRPHTTEDAGEVWAENLIYSGNHYEAVEVSPFGKAHFVAGIHPRGFRWRLEPGESFQTPEAVMSYSPTGFQGLSRNMHRFVREHIVRGVWQHRERPVLLNSWEAAYFGINERKLVSLAKTAASLGAELFVVDDGWFGKRDDDRTSLGDWFPNSAKLPGGVKGLSEKIHALGLDFGIWVEPEMVSVDSELYRAHPDWAMEIPGRAHSEGRNQRILDLGRAEVQDYLIDTLSALFSGARIDYVKWDMNRNFTDVFSRTLPPERQGEASHRYYLGLYRCMRELAARFPEILFEGCSGGGNRFDLGILCFFPQIWASDNTDALQRVGIQQGYSYGYPQSTYTCHVSACPNHQTLRTAALETRFHVAAFGVLGYELNLNDLTGEEKQAIATQIALYKEKRQLFQYGEFYRMGKRGELTSWCIAAPGGEEAVGMLFQRLFEPNHMGAIYRARGLQPEQLSRFYSLARKEDIRQFGDLVNTMTPVHIRPGSMVHNLAAKFVKLDGETEDCTVSGGALMEAGVQLSPAFIGTGLSSQVRIFPDFASRMYFME